MERRSQLMGPLHDRGAAVPRPLVLPQPGSSGNFARHRSRSTAAHGEHELDDHHPCEELAIHVVVRLEHAALGRAVGAAAVELVAVAAFLAQHQVRAVVCAQAAEAGIFEKAEERGRCAHPSCSRCRGRS